MKETTSLKLNDLRVRKIGLCPERKLRPHTSNELASTISEFQQNPDVEPDDFVWEFDAAMEDYDPYEGLFDEPEWVEEETRDFIYYYING